MQRRIQAGRAMQWKNDGLWGECFGGSAGKDSRAGQDRTHRMDYLGRNGSRVHAASQKCSQTRFLSLRRERAQKIGELAQWAEIETAAVEGTSERRRRRNRGGEGEGEEEGGEDWSRDGSWCGNKQLLEGGCCGGGRGVGVGGGRHGQERQQWVGGVEVKQSVLFCQWVGPDRSAS
jgi:hypothetical protein